MTETIPTHLAVRYPQEFGAVARYGFSWGIEIKTHMIDFFCPQHMGFGTCIEYEALSDSDDFPPYALREPLTAAVYDIAHGSPAWVDDDDLVTGLEQIAAVAEQVTATGLPEHLTAFTLLLYQVRKHYFVGHHEKIDDPAVVTPMFTTAADAARSIKLTDLQKLDFMHHVGEMTELERMLDHGIQYSLAAELFAEKPLLYF